MFRRAEKERGLSRDAITVRIEANLLNLLLKNAALAGAVGAAAMLPPALPLLLALVLVWSASQAGDFEEGSLDGMPANGDSDGVPCADCKS